MWKIVFLLLCVFSLSIFGQDKSCVNFKTGEFRYANTVYADWKITRTSTEQIETNTATGLVIHNTIKWVTDCELILTCNKVSLPKYKHAVGKVFKVVITETSSDGYTCIMMRNDIQPNDMVLKMIRVD